MQVPSTSTFQAQPAADDLAQVEAARYALMRRLAPTIRHHLIGEFQPLGMVTALMDRRLQASAPNISNLRENSSSLGQMSRSAAESCMKLMTWFAPKENDLTRLDVGVLDCLSVLTTDFRFRGLVIVNEVKDMPMMLSRTALRSVLPAALIALSDEQSGAADLRLQARKLGNDAELSIVRIPAERPADNSPTGDYRRLNWRDVQALARAEAVGLSHAADNVRLVFTSAAPSVASVP